MEKLLKDLLERCGNNITKMEFVLQENKRALELLLPKLQYGAGTVRTEIGKIQDDLNAINLGRELFQNKNLIDAIDALQGH